MFLIVHKVYGSSKYLVHGSSVLLDVNICTGIGGLLGDAVCKNCYHHYECFMINDIITASMSLVMIVQVAQAVGGFELTP